MFCTVDSLAGESSRCDLGRGATALPEFGIYHFHLNYIVDLFNFFTFLCCLLSEVGVKESQEKKTRTQNPGAVSAFMEMTENACKSCSKEQPFLLA